MGKILPALLALIGLAAGTGAGMMLRPADDAQAEAAVAEVAADQAMTPEAEADHPTEGDDATRRSARAGAEDDVAFEYVKLNNQFVVPVVHDTRVTSLVVMSLSVEVAAGQKEVVFAREPKLRDAFLQVLFDHANSGGFDGVFTTGEKMNDLRGSLYLKAVDVLGPIASDVMVIDIVRQDV
jgi:flagellar FliL protein